MIFEKIRERLQKKWQSYMDEYGMIDIKIQEVFVEIRNIINQVEAEYNNGWIACSDRLPERRCELLVIYVDVNNVVRAGLTMYEPKRKQFWVSPSVTHWQPLPQLPKGE